MRIHRTFALALSVSWSIGAIAAIGVALYPRLVRANEFSPGNPPAGALVLGATLSDDWSELREVPAPVNVSGGWTDSVAVGSRGDVLDFAYSRIDFGHFYDSEGAVQELTGPVRVGMLGSAFKMFSARLSPAGWRVSQLPFNGPPNVNEASVGFNHARDLAVFSRFNAAGVATLYYTVLQAGAWSEPTPFPTTPAINSPNPDCTNDNAYIVGNLRGRVRIYFESNRADLAGTTCRADRKNRLYYSTFSMETGFSAPRLVPGLAADIPGRNDTQIFVTLDRRTIFFTRATHDAYGIFTADWDGAKYANVRQVVSPTLTPPYMGNLTMVGEATMAETASGKILYMICGIAQSEGAKQNPSLRICYARKP